MDWGRTNGSELEHWADRPTPELSQGIKGVALELMIELANRSGTDAWFCVPHKADDQYVTEMAKLIKARLDPRQRVYIEYSNELWNAIFEQVRWSAKRGCTAGLNKLGAYPGSCDEDGPRYWAGIKWQARRSGEIFKIFEQVFAGQGPRLVRVLSGQAMNAHLNETLLDAFADPAINRARAKADVLAVAPYAGGGVANAIDEEGKRETVNVLQILDRLEKDIRPAISESTRANKRIADRHKLGLVAYEGGQHLVASGAAAQDERFVHKLIEAQRLPRMRTIYEQLLDAWYRESGNGLMVLFNFAEAPTKYGAWGLLENQEQKPEAAPKYQAFVERVQRLNFAAAERQLKAAGKPRAAASPPAGGPEPQPPAASGPRPLPPPAGAPRPDEREQSSPAPAAGPKPR